MQMDSGAPAGPTMNEVLHDALQALEKVDLPGERAEAVRLAVSALLIIRGSLHPSLFRKAQASGRVFNPYPVINKYVRASNAETLGGLVNDVVLNVSPEFLTLQASGAVVPTLFRGDELEEQALAMLKEETVPLVMFMKDLYQQARGFDEADTALEEEEII